MSGVFFTCILGLGSGGGGDYESVLSFHRIFLLKDAETSDGVFQPDSLKHDKHLDYEQFLCDRSHCEVQINPVKL